MKTSTLIAAGVVALAPIATPSTAQADCAFQNDTPVSIIANAFEAWKAVSAAMAECGGVAAELDNEFRQKQGVAFEQSPSLYQIGGVANSSIQPLLAAGVLRPLDDLVEKHGQALTANQLVRYGGRVMAIAMMVNTQHVFYREDIFADLGLSAPTTYAEMIDVAEAIRAAGVMEHPVGAAFATGWDLGAEFVNIHLGSGGALFDDDGAPAIASEVGVATLETMRALTEYMDPEYLLSNSTEVIQKFQQGEIAIASSLWADSAGAVNNPEESRFPGMIKTAPALMGSVQPAATLWWDGVVLAANQSEASAETAFKVALEGIDADMARENADTAIWLIDGAQPTANAFGAMQTAAAGAVPYPASVEMGLLHDKIGSGIAAFFTGESSAMETLAAVEADYLLAAREAGFIE